MATASGSTIPTERRASRPWRVLHASESVFPVATLVQTQLAVGMQPAIATPAGVVELAQVLLAAEASEPAQVSLLNAWNNVRQWRKVILDAQPEFDFELLHAHTFASGMAGVRNCPATVYKLDRFIEDQAAAPGASAEQSSWLSRSFRVAEQFVLSRAAAVVVANESLRRAVIHRGAAAENVFAIPEPIDLDTVERSEVNEAWLDSLGVDRWHRVLIHAPEWTLKLGADGILDEASRGLLEAFAMAAGEEDGAYLLVEAEPAAQSHARAFAESLEIERRVLFVRSEDRSRAFDAAHIVIAGSPKNVAITPVSNPIAERALLTAKSLLAADLPCNRDITPSGRGCLWYRSGDYKDLAYRMAFLARNRDFRSSLAESGHRFICDTRDAASVAMEYDRVYRHAAARRKSGGLQTPAATLVPASAMV